MRNCVFCGVETVWIFFSYFEYPLVFSGNKQNLYKLVSDCKQSNTDGEKSTGKSDKALWTNKDDCEPFLFTLSRTAGLVTSTKEPDTINQEKKAMKFK